MNTGERTGADNHKEKESDNEQDTGGKEKNLSVKIKWEPTIQGIETSERNQRVHNWGRTVTRTIFPCSTSSSKKHQFFSATNIIK